MSETIFRAEGINKSFGVVRALNNVSFEVNAGEIRGLIGENGSGKSTVSSIIAGMQTADSGTMEFLGEAYAPESMVKAQHRGVAMIVQEIGTIPGTSVAHNILAGRENEFMNGLFVDKKRMNGRARKALDFIGLDYIDEKAPIESLNFEDRKLVELARAMLDAPRLLIVDETTTALSQNGREILYRLIHHMAENEAAVLFISHDLDELMEHCNVLTVLRDGNIIDHLGKERMEQRLIKNLMVGRELSDKYYREDYGEDLSGEVVLKAENVSSAHYLENFSLELHKGEILGIGGLAGSGIHELGYLLFGAEPCITGSVTVLPSGEKIAGITDAINNHVGYVSKNRDEEVLVLANTIRKNLTCSALKVLAKGGFITKKNEKSFAQKQIEQFAIKCYSMEQDVSNLSGGNKQKVAFGKWVGNGSDILILDCPTRGVDVAVKATMYQLMDDLRREGKAILLIAEELPELIGMSDRIMIIKDGKCSAEFKRDPSLTEHDIIDHMI